MSEEKKSPRKNVEVVVGEKLEGPVKPSEIQAAFASPPDIGGDDDVEGRFGYWTNVISHCGNIFWVYLVPGRNVFYDYFCGQSFVVYG